MEYRDENCIKSDVCDMAVCDGIHLCKHAIISKSLMKNSIVEKLKSVIPVILKSGFTGCVGVVDIIQDCISLLENEKSV